MGGIKHFLLLISMLAVTALCEPAVAGGVFQPMPSVQLPVISSTGFVTGDFNGDGRRDIASIHWNNNQVLSLLGTGTGSFSVPVAATSIDYPTGLAAGDINSDGLDDLVVIGQSQARANLLTSDGSGTFTIGASYGSSLRYGLGLGDLDGDGRADLVTTWGSYLRVQQNDHLGGFLAGTDYLCATNPGLVVIRDITNDGKPDVITTDVGDDEVVTFVGQGNGVLNGARSYASQLTDTRQPVIADFDDDGIPDVAVATGSFDYIEVHFGIGDGGLTRQRRIYLGGDPRSVAAADFNGDGLMDLAALDIRTGTLNFLAGHGDGTFAQPDSYQTARQSTDWSRFMLVDDFNSDGRPDIATLTDFGVLGVMTSVPEPTSMLCLTLPLVGLRRNRLCRVPSKPRQS